MEKTSKPLKVLLVIGVLVLLVMAIEMGYRVFSSHVLGTFKEGFASEQESLSQNEMVENIVFDGPSVVEADIPDNFEEEIFSLEQYQEIQTENGQEILSFWTQDSVDGLQEKIKTSLAAKGWNEIDEGSVYVTSYVKSGGDISWVLLQYSSVGGGTSVVVHYR